MVPKGDPSKNGKGVAGLNKNIGDDLLPYPFVKTIRCVVPIPRGVHEFPFW